MAALAATADVERNWDVDAAANSSETEVSSVLFPGLKYLEIRELAFDHMIIRGLELGNRIIRRPAHQIIDLNDLQENDTKIREKCGEISSTFDSRLSEVVVDVGWDNRVD